MSPGKDDKAFQRMMQGIAGASARPAPECPEPEILAAFYDRALDDAEYACWEEHFSKCADCQAQLAALVRSDPHPEAKPAWAWLGEWRPAWGTAASAEADTEFAAPVPAAQLHAPAMMTSKAAAMPALTQAERKSRWAWLTEWHYAWRWVVPVGALAASLAIWVAVYSPKHDLTRTVTSTNPVAVATTAQPNPAEPSKETDSNAASATPPAVPANKPVGGRVRGTPDKTLAKKSAGSAGDLASGRAAAATPAVGAFSRDRLSRPIPLSRQDEAKIAEAGAAQKEGKLDKTIASDRMSVAAAAPSAPAPPPSPILLEKAGQPQNAASAAKMKQAANERAEQSRLSSSLEYRSGERSNGFFVSSHDGKTVWWVGHAGVIERTADNGKKWQGQFRNEGSTLAAGSSPSPNVCWMVGTTGTVLRTIDGEHWEKLAAPADADLVSVSARDEKEATVASMDGRTFSTKNGGQTWELVQK